MFLIKFIKDLYNYFTMNKQNVEYFNGLSTNPKWQGSIRPLIIDIADKKLNDEEIIQVLQLCSEKYCWRRKVPFHFKYKKETSYQALLKIYRYQLVQICSDLAQILLTLEKNITPIRMVMGSIKDTYKMKKSEIFYILLLMFFSIVPKQVSDTPQYSQKFTFIINFSHILSQSEFKTQCLIEYFKKTITQAKQKGGIYGEVTIIRNVLDEKQTAEDIILTNPDKILKKVILEENTKSIEQFNGDIKVDFANRYIGGGSLTYGCVQQEIMFAIRPQLYATQLLCQKMEEYQSLSFIGFIRYFDYTGYSDKTKYNGPANVKYDISENNQVLEYITAIDAIKYSKKGNEQFQKKFIDREIEKAYAGFSSFSIDKKIVTGGWGCGIYNGDSQLKFMIQWIAATLADKEMIFCPFGRKKLLQENGIIQNMRELSVIKAYKRLLHACQVKQKKGDKETLFQIMETKYNSKL